ncbi:MAG: MGMT family protein [Candidatus Omnitrophica bacterium]|nr:MGMT family protein [Candidatus Omnitrophota bacterium]
MGFRLTLRNLNKIGLSPFAKEVYKVVSGIPLGEVRSYKWVAKKIGHPKAYRAVGQALKNNPWPLLVPCHRVIESSGELGDYIFGKKNKKKILDLERQIKDLVL